MPQWKKNLYFTWFTQILSLTGFGFIMPFIPYYIQDLGVTDPDQVKFWSGVLNAVPALSMGIMGPVWGMLSDRLGRKIMILRSMLAAAVIIVLMAAARNVQTIFILRVCQGLFTGTITASATLVAAGTPGDRLSSALGFLSSSTFIGLSIGPLIGGLASEFFGYRPTFLIGGGIMIAGFLIVLLSIKELTDAEQDSEETGKSGNLESAAMEPRPLTVEGVPVPDPDRENGSGFSLKGILRPPFISLFFMFFFARFSKMVVKPFLPIFVQELRGTMAGSAALVGGVEAAVGLVSAVSGITLPRLGDKKPRTRIISFCFGAAAVAAFPIFFAPGITTFILFYLVSAYFLGGVEPLLQAHMSIHTPAKKRGTMFGIQTSVSSAGWFMAPLAGSAVSIVWSTNHIFLLYSGVLFLSFLLNAFLTRR